MLRTWVYVWVVLCLAVSVPVSLAAVTERVSVGSAGEEGNGNSGVYGPSISADGRYVAFCSSASNLVPGDTNDREDVFVHDRLTGTTERVSVSSDGEEGNGDSGTFRPSISADGRYVAFVSCASNLVPGDTNWAWDIFVHDRLTGVTERVSVSSAGEQGDGDSGYPSISAEGRYVAFESGAYNLVPGDTNWTCDIFVHDRLTGTTERVSVSSEGHEGNGNSSLPFHTADGRYVNADGRYVASYSEASNLVPGDTNGIGDVFVRDRLTGTTERVSVSSDGEEGDSNSGWWGPSISADGRYVAFQSCAYNLVPGDTKGWEDVFVRDREGVGPADEFLPRIASVTVSPTQALKGIPYVVRILVVNDGGRAGEVTIALDEHALSSLTTEAEYSPDPPVLTRAVPAYGEARFSFMVTHDWEWIAAPPPAWQAVVDGVISCLPTAVIQQWAGAIKAAKDLEEVKQLYTAVGLTILGYESVSGLLQRQAEFRYLPGTETTPGLSFDHTVTVIVPQWKTDAFATSIGCSIGGTVCSAVGSRIPGLWSVPFLVAQAGLKAIAREHYKIAYDPDPDYMTIPTIEPISCPELEAEPDSAAKAAALAALAWLEAETARGKAWIRLAAAEEAGDDYWRRRQAQAAEELGREAAARVVEFQRLLPAVPELQAGMTLDEIEAFRQDLETNGLPAIERDFLLSLGGSEEELDALVQSMIDTPDEIYLTPGLQADATVLAGAGQWCRRHMRPTSRTRLR